MSAKDSICPIADGVRRAGSLGKVGTVGTLVGPRPATAIGTDSLDDVGPLMGAGPANSIGTGPFDEFGPRPLGEVDTHSLSGPSGPPPHEVAPLKLVKPLEPASRLFGVGTCSPASTVAVLAGAGGSDGSDWSERPATMKNSVTD